MGRKMTDEWKDEGGNSYTKRKKEIPLKFCMELKWPVYLGGVRRLRSFYIHPPISNGQTRSVVIFIQLIVFSHYPHQLLDSFCFKMFSLLHHMYTQHSTQKEFSNYFKILNSISSWLSNDLHFLQFSFLSQLLKCVIYSIFLILCIILINVLFSFKNQIKSHKKWIKNKN